MKAFTLVELIVVITILSILSTIGYISFQGYGLSSRDSVRVQDLKNIEKVLSLYRLKESKYPLPDDNTNITYSGSTIWTQGYFGKLAFTNRTSLSTIPKDPLTGVEYGYSVLNTLNEYQIAAVLEGEYSAKLSKQIYAGEQIAAVYVKGDYNGKFLRVTANGTEYILSIPSILSSDTVETDIVEIINNRNLVYQGFNNLPFTFSGTIYKINGGFDFQPNNYVLYEGSISDLEYNQLERIKFMDNLQNQYSGSLLEYEESIQDFLAVELDMNNPSDQVNNKVSEILNRHFGMKLELKEITQSNGGNINSCVFGTSLFGCGL